MASRLCRNYAALAAVLLIFVVSFQYFRSSGPDSPTAWSLGSWSFGDWTPFGQPTPAVEATEDYPLPDAKDVPLQAGDTAGGDKKPDHKDAYNFGEPDNVAPVAPAEDIEIPPWLTGTHEQPTATALAPDSVAPYAVEASSSTAPEASKASEALNASEAPKPPGPPAAVHEPAMQPTNLFKPNFAVPAAPAQHDSKGPKPNQIALLTATDGQGHNGGIPNILEQTAANRQEYCKHHGYVYQFVNISSYDLGGVHAVWAKLPAISETFEKNPEVEWVWWLDLDAIIMTPTRTMQDVVLSEAALQNAFKNNTDFVTGGNWTAIPGAKTQESADWQTMDLLITQDHNGLNAGSFLLRRSAWTKMLLDMWGDPLLRHQDWLGKEQDALLHLVKNHAVIRKNVGLVQQRIINGYAEGEGEMGWREGDIVVHFAGCWVNDECTQRWEKFWGMRGQIPSDPV